MGKKPIPSLLPENGANQSRKDYSRGIISLPNQMQSPNSSPSPKQSPSPSRLRRRRRSVALSLGRQQLQQRLHLVRCSRSRHLPALQARRQMHRAVAHPHQAADRDARPPRTCAAPRGCALRQSHAVPAVGALAAGFHETAEVRQAVFELDAAAQASPAFPASTRRARARRIRARSRSADASCGWPGCRRW